MTDTRSRTTRVMTRDDAMAKMRAVFKALTAETTSTASLELVTISIEEILYFFDNAATSRGIVDTENAIQNSYLNEQLNRKQGDLDVVKGRLVTADLVIRSIVSGWKANGYIKASVRDQAQGWLEGNTLKTPAKAKAKAKAKTKTKAKTKAKRKLPPRATVRVR